MSIYEHIDKLKELKSNLKQEFLKKGVDLSNVEFTKYHEHISSLGNSLQLYPVNIYRDATNLIIQDDNNGMFCTEYEIYDNGECVAKTKNKTYPINNLNVGEHNFSVVATGVNFIASESSNPVYYPVFNYVKNLTGLYSSYNSNAGMYQTITDYLSVVDGNYLPRDISVTVGGEVAEYVYNCYTGELIISNITGEVVVSAWSSNYPTLPKVEIVVENNNVSWTKVENATSYKVYANGELVVETQNVKVSLFGYLIEQKDYLICVTACAEGYNESQFSESVIMSYVNGYPIFGVTGLDDTGLESLERTYDAVGLNYYINSSKGVVVSDFDNLFPYCEMVEEEIDGNVMVKIPKMYFKIELTNQNILTGVAVSRLPRNDGYWIESKEFYVGKYLSSLQNDTLYSITNHLVCKNLSHSVAETKATGLGKCYGMFSYQQHWVIKLLMYIEYATKNLNPFLIKDSNLQMTGYTDVVESVSGFNLTQGNYKYHNIEDFIGGANCYLSGLKISKGSLQAKNDSGKYVDINLNLGDANHWIFSYKWLHDKPLLIIPDLLKDEKEGGYNCKAFVRTDGDFVFGCGGWLNVYAGLLPFRVYTDNNSENTASRLVWENKNDN